MPSLSDTENRGGRPDLMQKDNEFSFRHTMYELPVVPLAADVELFKFSGQV